jgi:hypothetical protein
MPAPPPKPPAPPVTATPAAPAAPPPASALAAPVAATTACSGRSRCYPGRVHGDTSGPHTNRGETGSIDAASGGGKARFRQAVGPGSPGSEKRCETSCQRASPCRGPACRDCRRADPGVRLGAHKMLCRVPRLLLRRGHRGWAGGRLPAIERCIAVTDLPRRLGRVGPLTGRKPADHWRDE